MIRDCFLSGAQRPIRPFTPVDPNRTRAADGKVANGFGRPRCECRGFDPQDLCRGERPAWCSCPLGCPPQPGAPRAEGVSAEHPCFSVLIARGIAHCRELVVAAVSCTLGITVLRWRRQTARRAAALASKTCGLSAAARMLGSSSPQLPVNQGLRLAWNASTPALKSSDCLSRL